jgi:phosphatidate cytidylyltransferase
MQYLLIANGNYEIFVIFVPLIVFLFLASSMVLAGETPGFISAISTLNWGLMLTVYLLGYVGFVLVITSDGGLITSNAVLVLFLVFLTELNDVAQYTFGKLFGTTTAIIKVSPNKTAEGFAGGLSITILSAVLIGPWLTSLTTWESLIAGILIGVAGFLGDITISAVKRDLGIKDTGRLLPGHGGVLDRVDSLLFTAPVFFHYIYQFKLY